MAPFRIIFVNPSYINFIIDRGNPHLEKRLDSLQHLIESLSLLPQLLKPEQCISYQVKALLHQRRFQPIIDDVLLRC
ncbi:unnamed protein product [Brassica rapa subsp. trilocularis]